ncbi:MAG: transcription antiterminator [Spirochaetales bacterium]|jgi:transcriptional antiterminator|nr:transcription antiterminator [Spirochaetales bacterium]
MQDVSPRLARLLELLLQKKGPVSVDELAGELDSSRRTLFRELKNADEALSPYGIGLTSVPGKGLQLSGDDQGRARLQSALRKNNPPLPGNRQERLLGLLLDLLDTFDIHKLFYFADSLGVSEATVSHDLDTLEPYLKERSITLIRKPGQGVCISGSEEAVRQVIIRRILSDGAGGELPYLKACDYPPSDVAWGVRELFDHSLNRALAWMTPDSLNMLRIFVMVSVERIRKGALLPPPRDALEEAQPGGGYLFRLSEFLAGKIEARFSLALPRQERAALTRQIKSCRAMLHNPFNPMEAKDYAYVLTLVHGMIEGFDPSLAPALKTNEHLLNGLSLHLWAALDRLEKRMELPDSLHGQVAEKYPELYEKTKRAAAVLEERLGVPIPSSEISLIAVHFYAVLFNLKAQNTRKRTLRVCIVCVAGIGVSYVLAAQIRQRYKEELEIDLSDCSDEASFEFYDFLISTIPLNQRDTPVVLVNSFLTAEDHVHIREAIDKYAFVEKTLDPPSGKTAPTALPERLKRVTELLQQVGTLFSNFQLITTKDDCSFEELAGLSASRFAPDPERAALVHKALMDREAISSQVIPHLKIVLLHARTGGVAAPVFAILMPEHGLFVDPYFQGAKSCLLMLLPKETPREMNEIMGIISSALVDNTVFLDRVHAGNLGQARSLLESEVSEYLVQYCKENVKE